MSTTIISRNKTLRDKLERFIMITNVIDEPQLAEGMSKDQRDQLLDEATCIRDELIYLLRRLGFE
jgi:hypothetical protein